MSSVGGVRAAVIIPVLNGSEMLRRTLEPLLDAGDLIEIIVVDNASKEPIRPVSSRARVIRNEINVGFAHACNQGADAATAPLLLFLNSDAAIDAATLRSLIATAESDPAGAVWQPVIMNEDGSELDSAGSAFTGTGFLWHLREPPGAALASVFAVKGACLLIRRDVFVGVGGYTDAYFAYFEDTDLCWRVRLAGWEVRVVPGCIARHIGGVTTTTHFSPAEIDYLSFRNRLASLLSNASAPTLARVLPLHIAGCLGTAIAFAARGRPASAWAILRALHSPWRRNAIRESRRKAQSIRRRPDREVLRPGLVVPMTLRRAWRLLATYLPRWTPQ